MKQLILTVKLSIVGICEKSKQRTIDNFFKF